MAITKISTPELFDFSATNTALQLPTGPTTGTGGRPATPSTGEWRYNTTEKYVEYWDGVAWRQIDTEAIPVDCTTDTVQILGIDTIDEVTPTGTTGGVALYQLNGNAETLPSSSNDGTATNVI